MSETNLALFIWINDNPITGNVLSVGKIKQPRKPYEEYKVGDQVKVTLQGYGIQDSVIGMIGEPSEKKKMDATLNNTSAFQKLILHTCMVDDSQETFIDSSKESSTTKSTTQVKKTKESTKSKKSAQKPKEANTEEDIQNKSAKTTKSTKPQSNLSPKTTKSKKTQKPKESKTMNTEEDIQRKAKVQHTISNMWNAHQIDDSDSDDGNSSESDNDKESQRRRESLMQPKAGAATKKSKEMHQTQKEKKIHQQLQNAIEREEKRSGQSNQIETIGDVEDVTSSDSDSCDRFMPVLRRSCASCATLKKKIGKLEEEKAELLRKLESQEQDGGSLVSRNKPKAGQVLPEVAKEFSMVEVYPQSEVYWYRGQRDSALFNGGEMPEKTLGRMLDVFFSKDVLKQSAARGTGKFEALNQTVLNACICFIQKRWQIDEAPLIKVVNDKCAHQRRSKRVGHYSREMYLKRKAEKLDGSVSPEPGCSMQKKKKKASKHHHE